MLAVKDNGAVFSTDGVRKAEQAFEGVTFQAPTKLAVVTFGKVPEGKRAAFDEAKGKDARDRFFREWAEEVARSSGKYSDDDQRSVTAVMIPGRSAERAGSFRAATPHTRPNPGGPWRRTTSCRRHLRRRRRGHHLKHSLRGRPL